MSPKSTYGSLGAIRDCHVFPVCFFQIDRCDMMWHMYTNVISKPTWPSSIWHFDRCLFSFSIIPVQWSCQWPPGRKRWIGVQSFTGAALSALSWSLQRCGRLWTMAHDDLLYGTTYMYGYTQHLVGDELDQLWNHSLHGHVIWFWELKRSMFSATLQSSGFRMHPQWTVLVGILETSDSPSININRKHIAVICTELSILTSSLDDYTYDVMADTTLAPRTQQTQVSKRIAFGAKQMVDQSKQVYQLC